MPSEKKSEKHCPVSHCHSHDKHGKKGDDLEGGGGGTLGMNSFSLRGGKS